MAILFIYKPKDNSDVREEGFTLVEMCVVLVLASLFLGMFISYSNYEFRKRQIESIRETVTEVDIALARYNALYGALPCPANLNATSIENPEFGISLGCEEIKGSTITTATPDYFLSEGRDEKAVVTGLLPTRVLNLPDRMAKDVWGTPIYYSVTQSLTDPALYSQTQGAIYINDAYQKSSIFPEGAAQYVFVMHGPDRIQTGSENCSGQLDSENCDRDAAFLVSQFSDGSEHYDDMLYYKTYIVSDRQSEGACDLKEYLVSIHGGSEEKLDSIDPDNKLKIGRGQFLMACNSYVLKLLGKEKCTLVSCGDDLALKFGESL